MDSTSSKTRYDVFLSFRGEDTRHNFISHLYAAFCRKCITTFIDDNLEREEEISPNLLKAIEESKLSVIIFSENYASSRCCLDAVLKIMESKKTKSRMVLPVFYGVDPSDVRNQTGSFGAGFGKIKETFKDSIDMVQNWSSALMEVASLAGWVWSNFRNDSKLIEKVVEEIVKKLYPSFYTISTRLVGIDAHIEQIQRLLCFGSVDVLFIGIWGMGGIGKTTIAEAVFSRISNEFDACHFLRNVRERSSKDGLVRLRKCLFSELLQDQNLKIEMPHALPTSVVDRLTRMKVLVVLDDVDDPDQLKCLVGNHGWFGPGSRAIITSRDKEVFNDILIDRMYPVEGLDVVDALQLLSMKAFQRRQPPEDFIELSEMVVNYAKSVPLALEVLGSQLCKRSPMEWRSALNKLKQEPNPKIKETLEVSYDSLDQGEKNMFLDIACFFKNEDKKWVEDILVGCGFAAQWGIIRLMDKCLISVVDNRLKMHDLIQEMGQDIARRNGSRLWNAEEICRMLRTKKGKEVEGILLDMSKMEVVHLSSKAFKLMDNLRVLKFHMPFWREKYTSFMLDSDDLRVLPSKLSLLHWDHYPYKSLPSNFYMDNLVELNLRDSKIEQLWDEDKCPAKLKRLILSYSVHLKRLPDLSSAANLEEIDVESCTSLVEVPSLNHLKSLKTLVLSHCFNLKILPAIPRGIENLALERCGMEEWPVSIQYFDNLRTLHIRNCIKLTRLPNTVHWNSHGILHLEGCLSLRNLPEITGNLRALALSYWTGKELPSSLFCLPKLVELRMVKCTDLESLSDNISELKYLQSLDISGCSKLGKLPELPCQLSHLEARDCTSLKAVSSSLSSFEIKENPGKKMYYGFNYSNCLKLDQKACCDIMEDAKIRIEKLLAATKAGNFELEINARYCFPGSEIPEWITNQSEGSSIVIPPPPCGLNTLLGFAMCFVLEPQNGDIPRFEVSKLEYQCKCSFINASGNHESWPSGGLFMANIFKADHVLLWFENANVILSKFHQSLQSDIVAGENSSIVNEVVFDFDSKYEFSKDTLDGHIEPIKLKVKRCGVQPFYAKDNPRERNNNGYVEQVMETDNTNKRRGEEIYDVEEPESKRLK